MFGIIIGLSSRIVPEVTMSMTAIKKTMAVDTGTIYEIINLKHNFSMIIHIKMMADILSIIRSINYSELQDDIIEILR